MLHALMYKIKDDRKLLLNAAAVAMLTESDVKRW